MQYGIFDFKGVAVLKNATSIEGAGNIYIKVMLREYFPDDPDKQKLTAANLQLAYDDWADTAQENMQNDGYKGEFIESVENMVDNWSNRYHIVTRPVPFGHWESINNTEQYELLNGIVARKNVQEKTFTLE